MRPLETCGAVTKILDPELGGARLMDECEGRERNTKGSGKLDNVGIILER